MGFIRMFYLDQLSLKMDQMFLTWDKLPSFYSPDHIN